MSSDPPKPRPERDETDQSLRTERKNTDEVLAEQRTRIEDAADEVVERAREQADAVLDSARDKADDKLDAADAAAPVRAAVAKERAREDETLKDERTVADEALRREREDQARALAALLPLEREKTDRHLFTERERSDHTLAHRDDFMGMVSHDLRNLLGGIAGNAALLSKLASESDEGRRTLGAMERIERYIARMNRLIGDLVDVASIDAGKLAMHPQMADAAELVNESVGAYAQTARDKDIALEARIGEPALPCVFDRERMLQVLANLIANSLKFTPRGGAITIAAERAGDDVRLSVRDTGSGIPAEMLEVIFERFWQVGKNDQRGLGLGLYISRCIVDAHGGRIWAESTVGSGSAFHFTIPAGGAVAPAAASPAA
jgi:signal transduction histidine kinase